MACRAAIVPCAPCPLEATFCLWSCMYVVWRARSAQSGCVSSVHTTWAEPVQKTRPEKLLMAQIGSVGTKKSKWTDVKTQRGAGLTRVTLTRSDNNHDRRRLVRHWPLRELPGGLREKNKGGENRLRHAPKAAKDFSLLSVFRHAPTQKRPPSRSAKAPPRGALRCAGSTAATASGRQCRGQCQQSLGIGWSQMDGAITRRKRARC